MKKKENLEDKIPAHIKYCIEQKGIVFGLQQGCAWYCSAVEKCPYKTPSEGYRTLSYCSKRMRR